MSPAIRALRCLLLFVAFASGLAACSENRNAEAQPKDGAKLGGAFVLALSWEPAFCETAPRVPECRVQTQTSLDALQFSLHGLWPEQSYCGVDATTRKADERHDWENLPEVDVSAGLRRELDSAMPGALSGLDRHEWIKHGTCSGTDQQSYYAAALALTEAINASSVPRLFVENLGRALTADTVLKALETDLGAGLRGRVALECVTDGSRRLISGIRIALSGQIGEMPDLGALAGAAKPLSRGCKSGIVDPAGLQ